MKLFPLMRGLGVAVLLLAGCSGVPVEPTTASPRSTPTPTPAPTPLPTETPSPTAAPGLPGDDTWIRPSDGMAMVYVPGGVFQMGSTDDEVETGFRLCNETWGDCKREWLADEQPLHTVVLDAFWMDRTEVTNEQYARCVADDQCAASRCADDYRYNGDGYPVVCVSWEDARNYCAWAGARLSTEAEWEYAARGSERRVYPWGDEFDCARGNFDDEIEINYYVVSGRIGCDGYVRPAPVGSFPEGESWCKVLDMAGNVWEWVSDWYGSYSPERQANPKGPDDGEYKVLRGGSWNDREHVLRSVTREADMPQFSYVIFGLRCAMTRAQGP